MPEEVVLSLSAKNRRTWQYIAFAGPFVALAIFLAPLLLSGSTVDEILVFFSEGPIWIVAIPALLPLVIVYVGLVNQSERLAFGESHFERRGIPHPSIYRRPVPYSDVRHVRAGGFGLLVIDVAGVKPLRFFPEGYEGGTRRVLSQLRKHIPGDRFQGDLEAALKVKTRRDRLAPAFSLAALGLLALGGWSDELIDLVRKKHAWTVEFAPRAEVRAIEDFQLGPDGVVWLYVSSKGGYSDLANYALRRVDPTGEQTWWLPAEGELFPGDVPEHLSPFAARLSLSEAGEPRLAIGAELSPLRLTAGKWVWETAEMSAPPDPFGQLARITGDPYWTDLRASPAILAYRAGEGSPAELDLGTGGEGILLDWRVDYLGNTLARITASDGRAFLRNVSDTGEPDGWFQVDLSGVTLVEPWELVDYATDPTGAMVVLVRDETYCDSEPMPSHLGRLNPESKSWRWRTVYQPGTCDRIFGEPRFIVDGYGRIWLPGTSDVSVFPPETLFGGELSGAIHYTRYNSGLTGGARLQTDSEGRLWAMDPYGDGVSWIDPTGSELQRPLPAWIAAWRESIWLQLAPMIAGVILLYAGFLWIRHEKVGSRS
jgi:hypothetical protein